MTKEDILIHQHREIKNNLGQKLSEIILGGQDGLVNTLGVLLGIAAASNDFRIVIAGSLAGAIAESISMGAVGYTSTVASRDYYHKELEREKYEIENMPLEEEQEIREIYEKKGFQGELLEDVVKVLTSDKRVWLMTMMQEELGLTPIEDSQPLKSAFSIGISSFFGAMIPLFPFMIFYFANINFEGAMTLAIISTVVLCAVTLFIVGVIKAKLTIGKWYKSGTQMLVIGIVSALFGFFVGKLFTL